MFQERIREVNEGRIARLLPIAEAPSLRIPLSDKFKDVRVHFSVLEVDDGDRGGGKGCEVGMGDVGGVIFFAVLSVCLARLVSEKACLVFFFT